MPDSAALTRAITAVARGPLRDLGLHQKGRSRLWYDDRGWSAITVEFQSSSTPGTYLNVGPTWLWWDKDHWTFDEGTGPRPFVGHHTDEQFRADLVPLVDQAVQTILGLRADFPDPGTTAERLAARPVLPSESSHWHAFHTGAAAGLAGDATLARDWFGRIRTTSLSLDHELELARVAADLSALDPAALTARLRETIASTRERLGLPG